MLFSKKTSAHTLQGETDEQMTRKRAESFEPSEISRRISTDALCAIIDRVAGLVKSSMVCR